MDRPRLKYSDQHCKDDKSARALTKDLLLSLKLFDSAGFVSLKLPPFSPSPPAHATLAGHQSELFAPVQTVRRYLCGNRFGNRNRA